MAGEHANLSSPIYKIKKRRQFFKFDGVYENLNGRKKERV